MSKHLAFVFPGQGSQKVGMLAELAELYPVVEETFAQASAVLGYDLWQLIQNGPQEELNLTENIFKELKEIFMLTFKGYFGFPSIF